MSKHNRGKERHYATLNYPSPGGATAFTGIRAVDDAKRKVYLSGFYTNQGIHIPFVYRGKLNGKGTWYILNYPSTDGVTVKATSLYGPNNGKHKRDIQVVGNYTTQETGNAALGCLYEGSLYGTGTWTTLVPSSLVEPGDTVLNTIAHSTMGGLVVGNYDTRLIQGRAFIYDITKKQYYNVVLPTGQKNISVTAYGIWHNEGDSYTICGSVAIVREKVQGYLVDWNNTSKTFANLRLYSFNNDPAKSLITHFDGISGDCGEYYLTGDYLDIDRKEHAFFARVGKHNKAKWSIVKYPHSTATSGNSVLKNVVVGSYISAKGKVNGYVSI